MRKIFIIEDDEDIREIVQYALRSAGFDVLAFEKSEDFFPEIEKMSETELPVLLILDIMLPGEDGLTILKKLRGASLTEKLPVILVSAKSSEFDKVKGLDTGADDYLTKPFGVMELISRVNAVLRRTGNEKNKDEKLQKFDLITIDNNRRIVKADDIEVILTFKEYELLYYLMINKELALDRSKIMEAVWGFDFEGESRTLDMHIRSLRQKLGPAGCCIKTIRNVGYKLERSNKR